MSDQPGGTDWEQGSDGKWYQPGVLSGAGWWRASDNRWYRPELDPRRQPTRQVPVRVKSPSVIERWRSIPTWGKGLLVGAVGVFLLVALIGAIVSSADEDASSSTASTTEAPATTEVPATTTTTARETTTTTERPTTTTTEPVPVVNHYEGAGDDIVEIDKPDGDGQPAIITIHHQGASNFVVESLDSGLTSTDLLVNVIGNYDGIVPLDFYVGDNTTALQITADGNWQIDVGSLGDIRQFSGRVEGRGDDVLLYTGDTAPAHIVNFGESNFVVQTYGDSSDLLVNEIGAYDGTVPMHGGAVVQVSSAGIWSIDTE